MQLFLPDTHAIFWYEFGISKLSPGAEGAFKDAESGQAQLICHPIVLAEFCWLLKKVGLESHFPRYVQFVQSNAVYRFEPITFGDIQRLQDFDKISEMHDRLIAITASRLGATMVTQDDEVRRSGLVSCLW